MALEYFTNTIDGKNRRVDIHALVVNGELGHEMPINKLYSALVAMGCPRITNQMGRADLLLRYGVWRQELEEANKAECQ